MNTVNSTVERVRAYLLQQYRGSRSRFAEDAGLSKNALRDIHKPDWNPRYETITKLDGLIPEGWRPDAP